MSAPAYTTAALAPAHWEQADRRPLRGCCVCTHSLTADGKPARSQRDGATWCQCPAVAGQRGRIPILEARNNHGPCGPEARHQFFPGLVG